MEQFIEPLHKREKKFHIDQFGVEHFLLSDPNWTQIYNLLPLIFLHVFEVYMLVWYSKHSHSMC